MKKYLFYPLILLMIFALFLFRNQKETEISKTKIMMSTYIEINLKSKKYDYEKLAQIVDSAFLLIEEYEKKLSYYDKNSLLSQINENLTENIDEDIYKILKQAQSLYYASDSLYDVSIGSLLDVWKVSKRKVPPQKEELDNCEFGFYR